MLRTVFKTLLKWYAHLLAAVNQPLLDGRDALFLFDALFDARDFVVWLDVQLDFLAGEGADPRTWSTLLIETK